MTILSQNAHSFQEAMDELLKLASSYMEGKTLMIGTIGPSLFSVIKLRKNETNCILDEGLIINLEESICYSMVTSRRTVIIEDTEIHPLTKDLPFVKNTHIRSYLGVPILMKNGELFGTLCAVDSKTSSFTTKDKETLEALGRFFSYLLEIEQQAKLDSLTGLYNRHSLYSYFERLEKDQKGTLMFLDLNGFKQVNDTFGHEVGDMVLKELARRIRMVLQHTDMAVRLGGDEFVINFIDLFEPEEIEKKVTELLQQTRNWNVLGNRLNLSLSVGIVLYPQDGSDIKSLLRYADYAMYRAKREGQNKHIFFKDFSF